MTDEPLSYWIAVARLGFENDFHRIFDQSGMSRAELAKRINATAPYISKVLNSTNGNFQLETMAKWARAIGAILQIRLTKEGEEVVRVLDVETAIRLEEENPQLEANGQSSSQAEVTDLNRWRQLQHEEAAAIIGGANAEVERTTARESNG